MRMLVTTFIMLTALAMAIAFAALGTALAAPAETALLQSR